SRDQKEKRPVPYRAFPQLSPVKASCAKNHRQKRKPTNSNCPASLSLRTQTHAAAPKDFYRPENPPAGTGRIAHDESGLFVSSEICVHAEYTISGGDGPRAQLVA